jgi:transposase
MGKNPRYTNEFKVQALKLLRTSGKGVAQVAKELGIARAALYKWKRQPAATETGKRARAISLEEENRALRRENARLKAEQEFLKKTAAFFARQSG